MARWLEKLVRLNSRSSAGGLGFASTERHTMVICVPSARRRALRRAAIALLASVAVVVGGLIPAGGSIAAAIPSAAVPGVPASLVATVGDASVSLGWVAPSDNGW